MIIRKDTHSPAPQERLSYYECMLSNHIERAVLDGRDIRSMMKDMARRTETGERLQQDFAKIFGGKND